ncbi:O-antigen ligase family protein [Kangiella sediminilitoris]|uniref:O-antigen polymerase n=1 Tax=Kangiella sediminilitoris TaxID=1144748 RepID=A0A1B3BBK1_9GAMM|nr:O-antigen ligase family protein [Kangiella sediminilitoris]AOE50162.1 hypothetical protein KS2013_1450 [Kangiella sediminilitoris]
MTNENQADGRSLSRVISRTYITYTIGLCVFIDLYNGYLLHSGVGFSISALYKATIIVASSVILIKLKFSNLYLLLALTIFMLAHILLTSLPNGGQHILSDLNSNMRVLYPVFLSTTLFQLLKKNPDQSDFLFKNLCFYGSIASVAILVNVFTGLGIKTYGDYAFGFKSYFDAANEIGLVLQAVAILIFAESLKGGFINFRLLFIGLIVSLSAFCIGSITGMFGMLFSLIVVLLTSVIVVKSKGVSFKFLKVFGIFFISIILILGYFVISKISAEYPYVEDKITKVISGEGSRDLRADAAQTYLASKDDFSLLLGSGFTKHGEEFSKFYARKGNDLVMVEKDVYDVIGNYGILYGAFILLYYYSLPVMVFFASRLKLNFIVISGLYSLSFIVMHSIYAGHVIYSPVVSTIYFSIGVYLIIKIKSRGTSGNY